MKKISYRPHHIPIHTCGMSRGIASIVCTALCTASFLLVSVPPAQAAITSPSAITSQQQAPTVQSTNWDPSVKTTLNEFIQLYGRQSPAYDSIARPYAVFDFDNTTSIMDMEEQLMIWQLDHLAFAVTPDTLQKVLETGIPTDKLTLTYGADDGDGQPVQINDAIHDAVQAYSRLYAKGLVKVTGSELSASVKASPDYREFTAKMRWLYDAIGERMDTSVSYPWVTYWFTGMTPTQVYQLACACNMYYGDPDKGQTWTKGSYASPSGFPSQSGAVRVSYKNGITVTPEIKELYNTLSLNGIDVWINSASPLDVIRAAVDVFSIPGVKGIVAMTNKTDKQGKYINAYDYDLHPQTQGIGKAETIAKVIAPRYQGRGPIFCAMDSQGDFNFCTEFKDTKAVLIMNRRRTDDAAICAAIAAWQQDHHITLQQANQNGDTKFILQGRNETNGRLWPTSHTLLLGKTEPVYLSDKAKTAIADLDQGKTIAQVLQKNTTLINYPGYKSR